LRANYCQAGSIGFSNCVIDSAWSTGAGSFAASTITYAQVGGSASWGGGNNISTCILNDNGSFSGSSTFGVLDLEPSFAYTFGSGETQTIGNNLIANGSCTSLVTMRSSVSASTSRISKSGGNINLNGVLLQDMAAIGGASFVVTNGIDNGNNTGWTITAPASRTYYWVGNGGNWNDPSHWSTTSGGTGGSTGCVPTYVDDVIFDAGSFTASGQSVTVDIANAYCRNITWTGVTNAPAFTSSSASNNLSVYGSLSLAAGMTAPFSGTLKFESRNPSNTIRTNGVAIGGSIQLNGIGGGWTLLDSLSINGGFAHTKGTFNTNSWNVRCNSFASSSGTLDLGSSTISCTCLTNGNGSVFSIDSGVQFLSSQSSLVINNGNIYLGGFTYRRVSIVGSDRAQLYGSNHIVRLDCAPIQFGSLGLSSVDNQNIDSLYCQRNYTNNGPFGGFNSNSGDTILYAQVTGSLTLTSGNNFLGRGIVTGGLSGTNLRANYCQAGSIGFSNCVIDSAWSTGAGSFAASTITYAQVGGSASLGGGNNIS
ncbi:MAG: hypothetical protein ACKOKF_06905, partial [Bacteroidota bacterium]